MTITTESACAFSTDPAEQVCEKGPRTGRPACRHFFTEYKRRILAEYEAAPTGSKGLVLRREGLYDASVKWWREQFEAGTLGRVSTPTPLRGGGKKTPEQARIAELEKALAKAEAESAKKDAAIAKREEALEVFRKGIAFLEALSRKEKP